MLHPGLLALALPKNCWNTPSATDGSLLFLFEFPLRASRSSLRSRREPPFWLYRRFWQPKPTPARRIEAGCGLALPTDPGRFHSLSAVGARFRPRQAFDFKHVLANALIRLALPCHRHIARVSPPPRGDQAVRRNTRICALHRGWDNFKCLNYLMKSTRTYVATSSRSCGTSIRSTSSPARFLIIAAVGGWRGYQYLEAKKAAEAGAAFDKAVELSEQNKHAEAEAAFTELAAKAPSGYRMLARLRAAAEAATRDPQAAVETLRRHCRRSQHRRAGAGSGPGPRRRIAAGYRNLSQHAAAARAGDCARRRPFAIPRANCWRCRPGAPTIPRRRGKWLDMIANDGETPSSLRSRAEALQALLPPVAKS